jgi:hypothetical protein
MYPRLCTVPSKRKPLSPACRSRTSYLPKFASSPNVPLWSSFANACAAVPLLSSLFRLPTPSVESATRDDRPRCISRDRMAFSLAEGTEDRSAHLAAVRVSSRPSSVGPRSYSGLAPFRPRQSNHRRPCSRIARRSRRSSPAPLPTRFSASSRLGTSCDAHGLRRRLCCAGRAAGRPPVILRPKDRFCFRSSRQRRGCVASNCSPRRFQTPSLSILPSSLGKSCRATQYASSHTRIRVAITRLAPPASLALRMHSRPAPKLGANVSPS